MTKKQEIEELKNANSCSECKNEISLHEGKIFAAKIDNTPFSPFLISSMDSFMRFMFGLYCNNVTVLLDESDCQLEYTRQDTDY